MRSFFGIIGILLAASPAAAQRDTELDTGSHIAIPRRARIPDDAKSDNAAAQIAMAAFARCVIARDQRGVARALGMEIGPDYWKAMGRLATSECLSSGQMKIPQNVMRGAIFAEVYRLYDAKKKAIVEVRPLDFDNPLLPEYRSNPLRYALLAFADCVIKRDMDSARKVVLLPPASREKDDAFRALTPSLGPCLTSGHKITFSKPILEGVIAEVLYRESALPSAPVGTK